MMSRRFALAAFGVATVVVAASCTRELTSVAELTDEEIRKQAAKDSLERLRDSLLNEGGRVVYTVHVVDGGKSSFVTAGANTDESTAGTSSPSSAGVAGVKVTTTQFGAVETMTTDASGMVVFPDMRVGKVAVAIDDAEFTSASFSAELQPPPANPVAPSQDITRNASTRVPIFPLSGTGTTTISGIVTYESDLTNGAAEVAADVGISASIITDAAFVATYINNGGEQTGKVLSITYRSAISSTTTSAAGAYTLTVPGTANGLPIRLDVSDVAVDQSLLVPTLNGQQVFGTQAVRTLFAQGVTAANTSTIPAVRPAFIDFDAPSGTGINQPPVTAAAATAVISNGNVVSANITNAGRGYTQAPNVVFSSTSGVGAAATATLTAGRITGVTVDNAGSGYDAVTATLVSSGTGATAVAEISREVTAINVTAPGTGYSVAPTVSIAGGGGSGATAVANILGSVSSFNITGAGINFTKVPTVQITGGGGSGATATATLTPGPIRQINVPTSSDVFFTANPTVTIGGDGTGATATATAAGPGRIASITIGNAGSGYTAPPTVAFTGGGGSGAIGVAVLDAGGGIAGVTLVNQGEGYTSAPTVAFTGGGGTGAAGTAVVEHRVSAVTLNTVGTDFTDATTGADILFDGAPIPGTVVLLNRSLAAVNVGAPGTNYTSVPAVTIIGDGSGASVSAVLRFSVGSITVTAPGSGYKAAPTVTIAGDGTGATATAVLGNGVLTGVTITNPGNGYTAPPNFILTGGGGVTEHAVLAGTVSGGLVTGATITTPGKGYTTNPVITIQTFLDAGAVNANVATGTVVAVNVTNPGLGYKGVPVIHFTSTTGAGAAATAVLDAQGRVSAINVTDAGSNYATPPAVGIVVPNSATRARGTVTVNAQGVVTGVTVTTAGEGYTAAPTATITPSVAGKGSGAIVEVRVTNGQVAAVVVVDGGSGYLGQNTPGNFFPVSTANVTGLAYRFSQPTGAQLTLRSGVAVVNDIYLGTGTRQVPP